MAGIDDQNLCAAKGHFSPHLAPRQAGHSAVALTCSGIGVVLLLFLLYATLLILNQFYIQKNKGRSQYTKQDSTKINKQKQEHIPWLLNTSPSPRD